ALVMPAAITSILVMNKGEAAYSVARVMNSNEPNRIASAKPNAAVLLSIRHSGPNATERQMPSSRRSRGKMAPTSNATPRIWPASTSGYTHTELRRAPASVEPSRAVSQASNIQGLKAGLAIGVQIVALAVDHHSLCFHQAFVGPGRTMAMGGQLTPFTE